MHDLNLFLKYSMLVKSMYSVSLYHPDYLTSTHYPLFGRDAADENTAKKGNRKSKSQPTSPVVKLPPIGYSTLPNCEGFYENFRKFSQFPISSIYCHHCFEFLNKFSLLCYPTVPPLPPSPINLSWIHR